MRSVILFEAQKSTLKKANDIQTKQKNSEPQKTECDITCRYGRYIVISRSIQSTCFYLFAIGALTLGEKPTQISIYIHTYTYKSGVLSGRVLYQNNTRVINKHAGLNAWFGLISRSFGQSTNADTYHSRRFFSAPLSAIFRIVAG